MSDLCEYYKGKYYTMFSSKLFRRCMHSTCSVTMFNLKVKTTKNSTVPFQGKVNGESTLKELQQALFDVTSIPILKQKILIGYPPKQIVGQDEDQLKALGFKNGEVIIVEEAKHSETRRSNVSNQNWSEDSQSGFPRGTLLKRVVPSDNSCLFTSVFFLVNGGLVNEANLMSMREIVANAICEQPQVYNEALLEKSNSDYCEWILKDTSWGGAIELSIFSDYYNIEIVALDAKAGLMNRFGEDKGYEQRIFLMYDGIHYDPLYLETYNGRHLYIFPRGEEWLLEQAYALVQEAYLAGQFTDTNKFKLVCKDCGFIIHGEEAAVHHAKETNHSNFEEIKRNV